MERILKRDLRGEMGEKDGSSTGMGLYLCKKLCDKMEMKLNDSFRSRKKGTEVRIGFVKA